MSAGRERVVCGLDVELRLPCSFDEANRPTHADRWDNC